MQRHTIIFPLALLHVTLLYAEPHSPQINISLKAYLLEYLPCSVLALSLFLLGSIANAQEADLFVIEDAFPNNVAVSDSYIKLLNEYDHSW
jgi:hypothetical protein